MDMKKFLGFSIAIAGLLLTSLSSLNAQSKEPPKPAKERKIISSAGARAMADACIAYAEKKNKSVALAIIDWGGNLMEFHAMEGAEPNDIETSLLKAKSALRWRRPTSATNKIVRSGENLAPTFLNDFPQPGGLPIVLDGQVIGAMGVSGPDGEDCAKAAMDAVFKGKATATNRPD
jgi:glc operon protein GlcG